MGLYIINFVFVVWLNVLLCKYLAEKSTKHTDQEKVAIVKFRELVKDDIYKDYMRSDTYLVRWLRTKKFNQDHAASMLRKAMKWRKENKMDGILDEVIYEGVTPFYTDGIDKMGSVVATMLTSRFDVRTFVVAGKRSVPVRYFAQFSESIEQKIYRNLGLIGNNTMEGTATDLSIVIWNLHGYNVRQHGCLSCFSVYLEFLEIMENYYPGYTKHFFFINTPRIFAPLLQLLKPLMSPMTANALKVYGQNKAEWQSDIIGKIIPPDQVRTAFGGTRAD